MGNSELKTKKLNAVEVDRGKSIDALLQEMGETGFQGKTLAGCAEVMLAMRDDPDVTSVFGYAGSLSTTGQWKIVNWLIENGFIDVLVGTGANLSEDIIDAMGFGYWQGSHRTDDDRLFEQGFNRYYDVYVDENEYGKMTRLLTEFILSLEPDRGYSSREFLGLLGNWLAARDIHSIVAVAAAHDVPVFCPAIADSPYGDAALLAENKGFHLAIDGMKDYVELMALGAKIRETGVVYIGGGVPKDFIQLLAVSADLLDDNTSDTRIPRVRDSVPDRSYPHRYAVQITTDSPQWGGLSGCTFEEAVSWGKETFEGHFAQCYCDATIALPIIAHAMAERIQGDAPPRQQLF